MVYLENIIFIPRKTINQRLFVKAEKYLVSRAKVIIWFEGKQNFGSFKKSGAFGNLVASFLLNRQVNTIISCPLNSVGVYEYKSEKGLTRVLIKTFERQFLESSNKIEH